MKFRETEENSENWENSEKHIFALYADTKVSGKKDPWKTFPFTEATESLINENFQFI